MIGVLVSIVDTVQVWSVVDENNWYDKIVINTISTFLVVKVLNIFTFVNTYNCGDEVLFHMCNLFAALSQRTQGEVFGRINYMKRTEHTNIHTF